MCAATSWGRNSGWEGLLDIPLVNSPGGGVDARNGQEARGSYFMALPTDAKALISPRSMAGVSDEGGRFPQSCSPDFHLEPLY